MIYRDFKGKNLSLLGFGAMRLPMKDKQIDVDTVEQMVREAMEQGVNYFDTAYPYHEGNSEVVLGQVLKRYPRDSFYLATKYPGHQISSHYDPKAVFEEQLEKCGVDYFDFYLLHNVNESSLSVYTDPKWSIVDYFLEQKRLGRIRHLGFSSHAQPETLKAFLDIYGKDMEFCQIQLNYVDWTLQKAEEKCALLLERGIPVWVMEPVRGGKLAHLSEEQTAALKALRPEESAAAWAFRWLQGLPNVGMILSGMSTPEQLRDNLHTFDREAPLSQEETGTLLSIAEQLKDAVPCTACRYCCDGCPKGLDIPALIATSNEVHFSPAMNVGIFMDTLPAEKRPEACIGCGLCAKICPQNIDIPGLMKTLAEELKKLPSWAELCRQRELAAKKRKGL